MEKRYWGSFYRYQTYRKQMREDFEADNGIDVYLSARDPYYWPSPEWIVSNAHFQRYWEEWRAKPPEWFDDGGWKRDLPPEYRRVLFGEERIAEQTIVGRLAIVSRSMKLSSSRTNRNNAVVPAAAAEGNEELPPTN